MKRGLPWALGVFLSSALMAALDGRGFSLAGWFAYLTLGALCAGLVTLAWRGVTHGRGPRWLLVAILVALGLRLALGLALAAALPRYGYDEAPQRAGYVFRDAYDRDNDSRRLAKSDAPLWSALTERADSDQYGGLTFISAAAYRYLSPARHRPMLVVLLGATASALAVLFTWAFVSLTFGGRAAKFAAWTVALYPEAVLLGASQMREPFVIMGVALAFFGYARLRSGSLRAGVLLSLLGVLATLPISPPYALAELLILGAAWAWEGSRSRRLALTLVIPGAAAVILLLLVVAGAWSGIGDLSGSALGVIRDWIANAAGQWRVTSIRDLSGWLDLLFDLLPPWAHVPFLVAYGAVQPLLPAALADNTGAPLWQAIAIYRAVGWFSLLPFLLYAPFAALRREGWRSLAFYLAVLVWVWTLLAAYRATGYQWDSPRYRAGLLAAQAALAGWAWVHARRSRSPWLRRTAMLVVIPTLVFLHWYIGRYYHTPRLSFFKTAGLAALSTGIYLGGVLMLDAIRARKREQLTAGGRAV